MKHPPLRRVFYTDSIDRMAVARRDGAITWADRHGDRTGILLWDNQAAAAAYSTDRWGYPAVIVEFEREVLDLEWMERCDIAVPGRARDYRTWLYYQEIEFGLVWWHQYTEHIEQLPTVTAEVRILASNLPEPELPQGVITLDVSS